MQAIVTVFDDPAREWIENIWGELKAVFGLPALRGIAPPHLTYQWADSYDASVVATLQRIAPGTPALAIEAHGLGLFRGDEVSLYLHVTPTPALRVLHAHLWRQLSPLATAVREVFAPATWLPHITIASGALTPDETDAALRFLDRKDYTHEIPVTNVCLAEGTQPSAWRRFDLDRSPG
jgi:2'-5' RNA ligase